ncbi:MAG: hypothetical protein Q9223_007677, partial [Gallowayella weberi]
MGEEYARGENTTKNPQLSQLPPKTPLGALWEFPVIPQDIANSRRRFQPPSPDSVPADLYYVGREHCYNPSLRYIRNSKPRELLIFIDGFCADEGTANARAGYAVKYGPLHGCPGRLEGDVPETQMGALLRAAFLALGYQEWTGCGFDTLVMASSCAEFITSVCDAVWQWKSNGWKTCGTEIPNRRLWEMLVAKLEYWDDEGMQVCFWLIPKICNIKVLKLAREGAEKERRGSLGPIRAIELGLGDFEYQCRRYGVAYDSDLEAVTYSFLSEEEVGMRDVFYLDLRAADGRARIVPAGGGVIPCR